MSDFSDAAPFPTPGMPDGRYVELPGRGTAFVREVAGPEGAPTLVLLHGWTANSALNWFATYAPLGEHFRVLALDHRGHGHGIRSWKRFTLEDCADDAVALLDALGVETAIPVGYSMGGPIAQLMWQRHPDRVEGLVLCATAARFRDRGSDRALQGVVTGLSLAARAAPSWMHKRVTERLVANRYDTSPLGCWARDQSRLNDLRTMIEAGHAVGLLRRPLVDRRHRRAHRRRDDRATTPPCPPPASRPWPTPSPARWWCRCSGGHDVCAVDPEAFVPALLEACTDVATRAEAPTAAPAELAHRLSYRCLAAAHPRVLTAAVGDGRVSGVAGKTSTRWPRTSSSRPLRSSAVCSSSEVSAPSAGLDPQPDGAAAVGPPGRHRGDPAVVGAVEGDGHPQDAGEGAHPLLVVGPQRGRTPGAWASGALLRW